MPGLSKLQNKLSLVKWGCSSAGYGVSVFGCRDVKRRQEEGSARVQP